MYTISTDAKFEKQFSKLNPVIAKQIRHWINRNLKDTSAPRRHGKPLTGSKKGLWRYRVGDYRLIALIKDRELIILCLNIGHRREIYK